MSIRNVKRKPEPNGGSTGEPSENVFLRSLEDACPADLGINESPDDAGRRRRKKRAKRGLSDLLLLVCIAVFCYCAVQLIEGAIDAGHAKNIYSDLSDGLFVEDDLERYGAPALAMYGAPTPLFSLSELLKNGIYGAIQSDVQVSTTHDLQIERLKIRLQEYQAQNPDIYGYIKIDDTVISYPFVLGEDNEFYLVHDPINKGYLDHGSIFADWRCDRRGVEYNRNTVLYGHHMTTGLMFADLTKFNDEAFFRTHEIYIYTTTGRYVYQPFSFFKTNERHQYFRVIFDSEQDYYDFLQSMKACSQFETDVTLTTADRILTLSTCTNITTSGRYCLQAKLVRIEQ